MDDKQQKLREYLMNKYSGDQRQELVDQNAEESSGINWAAGLAGLGAAMQGGNSVQAGQNIIQQQEQKRQNRLKEFDEAKRQEIQEYLMAKNEARQEEQDTFRQRQFDADQKYRNEMLGVQRAKASYIQTPQQKQAQELETFEKKEKTKEDVRVRTENRKERKKLDQDLVTWQNLEKIIDDAIEKAKKYNEGFGPGTGVVGKAKSYLGALAPETQALETQLQKLSLDQMVKQFAGMSKAIDTPAERAQFESTVPSIGMDDELLMEELKKRKQAAIDAQKRIQSGIGRYDRFGRFTEDDSSEDNQTETQNKTSIAKKQYSPSRNQTRIIYSDGSTEVVDGKQ